MHNQWETLCVRRKRFLSNGMNSMWHICTPLQLQIFVLFFFPTYSCIYVYTPAGSSTEQERSADRKESVYSTNLNKHKYTFLKWQAQILSVIHAESLLNAHYTEMTQIHKEIQTKYTKATWLIWKQMDFFMKKIILISLALSPMTFLRGKKSWSRFKVNFWKNWQSKK